MSEVCNALKAIISRDGADPFQVSENAIEVIKSFSSVSTLEKNLLVRCAQYQLFPESIFENESAANRNAQRIATTLIKRHGIEEKVANSIAVDICSGFAREGIKINVLQEEKVPAKAPVVMPKDAKKEDKPKKKGLFSFFKRG